MEKGKSKIPVLTGLDPRKKVEGPYVAILTEKDAENKILTVTLNVPEKRNALGFRMADEIADALEQAKYDEDVKVVVFKGAGAGFCSGHDMDELAFMHAAGAPKRSQRERLYRDRRRCGEMWETICRFTKPTICQIHGFAIGAGVQFALACDVAIASNDADINLSPIRFGGPVQDVLLPLWFLSVGVKMTKLLLFTGASLSARKAEEIGLITKAVPKEHLDDEVFGVAKAITLLPMDGLVLGKEFINLQLGIMGVMPGFIPGYIGHAFYSNIKYAPGEYNFLKTVRDEGMAKAFRIRDNRFKGLLDSLKE